MTLELTFGAPAGFAGGDATWLVPSKERRVPMCNKSLVRTATKRPGVDVCSAAIVAFQLWCGSKLITGGRRADCKCNRCSTDQLPATLGVAGAAAQLFYTNLPGDMDCTWFSVGGFHVNGT